MVTGKAMALPRPDLLHPGPSLQATQTVAGLGNYLHIVEIDNVSTYVRGKLEPDGMD